MNALKNIEMPMIYSGVPKKERIKRNRQPHPNVDWALKKR